MHGEGQSGGDRGAIHSPSSFYLCALCAASVSLWLGAPSHGKLRTENILPMILAFDDPAATLLANSGGKGASLARLLQGGFNVPPGIIIPATAYSTLLARNDE